MHIPVYPALIVLHHLPFFSYVFPHPYTLYHYLCLKANSRYCIIQFLKGSLECHISIFCFKATFYSAQGLLCSTMNFSIVHGTCNHCNITVSVQSFPGPHKLQGGSNCAIPPPPFTPTFCTESVGPSYCL